MPTETKRARGTLQPCRTLKNEMKPELVDAIPPPPEYLDEVAAKEWMEIVPQLKHSGVLSKIDFAILAIYCNEIATYIECQQQMRRGGTRVMVIKGDDGKVKYAQQVPYQKIANEAMERALKIAAEFGMTPAARTRIGGARPETKSASILDLVKGGNTKKAV